MPEAVKGSLDWIRSRAIRALSGGLRDEEPDAFVREVFTDSLIIEDFESGKIYEFDWKVEGDDVVLSNKREVRLEYVALKRKGALKAAAPPPPPPGGKTPAKPKEEDIEGGDIERVIEQLQKTSGLLDEAMAALTAVVDAASMEEAINKVRIAEGHLGLSWADERSAGEDDQKLAEASRMLNDERTRLQQVMSESLASLRTELVNKASSGDQEAQRLYYALSAGEEGAEAQALQWLGTAIGVDDTSAVENVKQIVDAEAKRLGAGEAPEAKDELEQAPAAPPVATKSGMTDEEKLDKISELTGPVVRKNAARKLVTTVVLVPGETDGEDGPISAEKVEDVAYEWMADWRLMDYEHSAALGGFEGLSAIPVESYVTKHDTKEVAIDGTELDLPAGTWMITSRVRDDLWPEVEAGNIGGASIMGVSRDEYMELEAATKSAVEFGQALEKKVKRVPLSALGDWFCPVVSLVRIGQVPKAKIVALKASNQRPTEPWWKKLFGLESSSDVAVKSDQNALVRENVDQEEEDEDMPMNEKERKALAVEVGGAVVAALKSVGAIDVPEPEPVETEEQRRRRETAEIVKESLKDLGIVNESGGPTEKKVVERETVTTEVDGDTSDEDVDDAEYDQGSDDDGDGLTAAEREELETLRLRDESFRSIFANADNEVPAAALKALFPDVEHEEEDPKPKKAGTSRAKKMDQERGRPVSLKSQGPRPDRDGAGRRINKPNAPVKG